MTLSFRSVLAATTCLCTIASGHVAQATITPGSLFSDNAVLQQKQADPVWGTADPNEPITVAINGQTVKTSANAEGKWRVTLKPIPAGGPYALTITGTGTDAITLNNIEVGEVWICGGQSNMQYPLKGWKPNAQTLPDVDKATDLLIHVFMVPNIIGLTPQATVPGKWQEANPPTAGNFSAVGYFFGRELRKALNVPVGLIYDNWGGTPAQAWTSKEALSAVPELKHYVDDEASYPDRYPKMLEDYNAALAKYNADKAKFDADVDAAKAAGTAVPTNAPRKPNMPPPTEKWPHGAAHLYNGMISPIVGYGIKGAIWYQGESNGNAGWEYKTLFPTMITDWRKRWAEGDFPFLFVQLAPFTKPNTAPLPASAGGWPELREAQRLTSLNLPNTGMAVITDVGDIADIHPQRKEPVGDRLALIARAQVYGDKTIEYMGPMFDSLKIDGANARVSFKHAAGLKTIEVHDVSNDGPIMATADKLVGFEVAGDDMVYHTATATIDGSTVVVTSPDVPKPVAVRYGWAMYPICNLSNAAGIPASPFKTDSARWGSAPAPPAPPAAPATAPIAK